MKTTIKFLIAKRGINWFIAVKNMYQKQSEGTYSVYRTIQLSREYKHTNTEILYKLMWELSTIKDFAQYSN